MDPNPNQPRFRSSGALSESSYRPISPVSSEWPDVESPLFGPETRKDPDPKVGACPSGTPTGLVEGRITVPTVETIHDASPVGPTDVRDADRAVAVAVIHER